MRIDMFNPFPQILYAPPDADVADPEVVDDQSAGSDDDSGKDASDADQDQSDGSGSALGDEGDDSEQAASPAAFPDDWREQAAGEDAGALKVAKRFSTPGKLLSALIDTRAKLSAGPKKLELPDAEDAKAMKAYRAENGIPEDAAGYTVPDDVKSMLSDEDKPVLSAFTEAMHEANAPQSVIDFTTKWYFPMQEKIRNEQNAVDDQRNEDAVDSMREDWGRDYKPNMQMAARFMESTGGVGRVWQDARLPADMMGEDGKPHPNAGWRIGDIPQFIQWASDEGRAKFGDLSFASSDAQEKHNNRKSDIEKVMKTDYNAYMADKAMQKEYGEILEAEIQRDTKKR